MNKYRTLRVKTGLNIKIAALMLNIKVDTLYKIEEGQRKPSPILKVKMSELYSCSINNL
jgi:DNA-binding XRE family transcriptional regulator